MTRASVGAPGARLWQAPHFLPSPDLSAHANRRRPSDRLRRPMRTASPQPSDGPARVPGQAAVRQARRARARRAARGHRSRGGRGRRGGRLSVRDQGAGADRQARQGRRDQDRQRSRGGAEARRGHPRDGHPRVHGPRGVGRVGLQDRRRVLRVDDPRPLREEASGDPVADGRDGHRGDRRGRSVGPRPAPHRARRGVHRRGRGAARDRRPHRRGRHRRRRRAAWCSSTTRPSPRTRR